MEVYALSHTNIDIKRYKLRSILSLFSNKLKPGAGKSHSSFLLAPSLCVYFNSWLIALLIRFS
jgi:hypothetical protein